MAFQKSEPQGKGTNVRYSNFLGMLYDHAQKDQITSIRSTMGVTDDDVKKGYGTPESLKTVAALKDAGITNGKITGKLAYIDVKEPAADAKSKTKILSIGLSDEDGMTFFSGSMDADVVGALCRKLKNVPLGSMVVIGMWGSKDGEYAQHGVSVKVDGAEVVGEKYVEGTKQAVDVSVAALPDALKDNKDVIRPLRLQAQAKYNETLVAALVTACRDARANRAAATPAAVPADAPLDSSDIPF